MSNEYCIEIGKSKVIQNYFDDNKDYLEFHYYYGFKVSEVPLEIVLSDPYLNKIDQEFKIKAGGIIRIDPFRCYKWHIDSYRGISLNMLLTPNIKSITLFGHNANDSEDQLDIIEFTYKPETLYWFNNQVQHTVINFEQPRYLFTIEFKLDKDELNFNRVRPESG